MDEVGGDVALVGQGDRILWKEPMSFRNELNKRLNEFFDTIAIKCKYPYCGGIR